MLLWIEWYKCVSKLKPACSHKITFMWLALALVGMSIRSDCLGVTSFVRAIGLKSTCYECFLRFYHSKALKLDLLTDCWINMVMILFKPLTVAGYIIAIVDGCKIAKEGRKMPAVKKLHQESSNNTKAEYIWGHSFQVIALLVKGLNGAVFAIPLVARIHEGVVYTNRDKRTLIDKMIELLMSVTKTINKKTMLVADSYYANQKVILPLIKTKTMHLISRIRSNAVAYYEPIVSKKKTGPGRKKKYGKKVILIDLFKKKHLFTTATMPIYSDKNVTISYCCINLLWKPIGQLIRIVLVNHPSRGKAIFISTNLTLDPLKIISIYSYRFKIEVSFKQAIRTLGTYAYHFWMKAMVPLKRISGNQYMHMKSEEYRIEVKRKINTYHNYVQIGCIAQGLLLHLSINFKDQVWHLYRSWLRTMKKNAEPSEMVVASALRSSLPQFLVGNKNKHALEKFISKNADPTLIPTSTNFRQNIGKMG